MPTVKELRAEAKAMGLHNYSRLRKAELIHKIDKVKGKRVLKRPVPKPRTRTPVPKPRTRRVPVPPAYTEEILPSYDDIKDDIAPNYYADIEQIRAVIIDIFPPIYKGNIERFYKDWDIALRKNKNLSTQMKAMAKALNRRSPHWKSLRGSIFAHIYVVPAHHRLSVPIKGPMLFKAISLLFDDLFRGKVPRRPDELAQELSTMSRMTTEEQKEEWEIFGSSMIDMIPPFKRLLGVDIVPLSTRRKFPNIQKNYVVRNAKGEIIIRKK